MAAGVGVTVTVVVRVTVVAGVALGVAESPAGPAISAAVQPPNSRSTKKPPAIAAGIR